MIEIRFHGRGGQGAVVASELLAQAAFLDGHEPQCFPFFGVERRGAPVTAFARIDDHPIGVRTSIVSPDIVVVLDPGLLATTSVTDGLKDGGLLLVNSPRSAETFAAPASVRRASVDATAIAVAHGLGSRMLPIVNTTVLGALARASGVVSLEALCRAIDRFVPSHAEANRAAAVDGFATVRLVNAGGFARRPAGRAGPGRPLSSCRRDRSRACRPARSARATGEPSRHGSTSPDARSATSAGSSARTMRSSSTGSGFPVIALDSCKGCGICAQVCPPKTIAMVALEEVAA